MKANLIRTEGYRYRKRYIYACTKCGAEYSRCQYNDRISDLCGACKSKLDKEKAKKQLEKRKAKHDAEVRNKAIDEFKQALKQELNKYDFWIYDIADSDGYTLETSCNRDFLIDEVAEQLKGGE